MKKALVIGIDNYLCELGPLEGCINDAERIAGLLSLERSGFLVKKLLNSEATRLKVKQEIQWCLSDSDFSIIFFAGHGVRTSFETYLATYDYQPSEEGVEVSHLQKAVTGLVNKDSTCLVILDCCHSGGAELRSAKSGIRTIDTGDIPSVSGAGRVLLAACKSDQRASEVSVDGKKHGLFSHHFCDAIAGHAASDQGLVTVNASFDYVASKLAELGGQKPVFRGDVEGQIVLAEGVQQKGAWRPRPGASLLTPDDAMASAESLLSQVLPKISSHSHADWQQRGYKDACQAFEPVLEWFERRHKTQPDLLTIPGFREKYESCKQIFKSLGNVMPGTRIPQGRIGLPLGAGTFGTVFRLSEITSTSPLCLKVYHAHDLGDLEKVSRFRRGYAAMKQLDHPRIVKVRELSEIPLGFFMDFIEGANSRAFNPSAQDPEIVVDLLLEVAETLQHAHGRGVIHRDVKPENILIKISEEGILNAYLTDFDLSWFDSATKVTKLAEGFGSHFYAAPEQINSPSSSVAHRATVDTYSFGQLCFFFIAGRDPMAFNYEGNIRTLEQELANKWTDSVAASEMSKLYKECTHITAEKRLSNFREICERLAKISLLLKSPDATYDTPTFIEQVRFTLSGEIVKSATSNMQCTFRSRSQRTEVSVRAVKDAPNTIGVEVTFRPNEIIMEGRTSHEARTKINTRIDSVLQQYARQYDTKRSGAKAGAFEISVRIDHLKKDRQGVIAAREIVAVVLDQIENA